MDVEGTQERCPTEGRALEKSKVGGENSRGRLSLRLRRWEPRESQCPPRRRGSRTPSLASPAPPPPAHDTRAELSDPPHAVSMERDQFCSDELGIPHALMSSPRPDTPFEVMPPPPLLLLLLLNHHSRGLYSEAVALTFLVAEVPSRKLRRQRLADPQGCETMNPPVLEAARHVLEVCHSTCARSVPALGLLSPLDYVDPSAPMSPTENRERTGTKLGSRVSARGARLVLLVEGATTATTAQGVRLEGQRGNVSRALARRVQAEGVPWCASFRTNLFLSSVQGSEG